MNQEFEVIADDAESPGLADPVDLILAAILLGRHNPLAPHHAGWIREWLDYRSDEELAEVVRTGRWPKVEE